MQHRWTTINELKHTKTTTTTLKLRKKKEREMGKKDKSGAKRRRRLEEQKEREAGIESMNNEAELQAELRALNGVNNNNNNNGHDDSRPTIYNNKGLLSKCDAIDLNLDFPQTLAVVSRIPVANAVPNYEDELVRETAFYTQAQAAVAMARQKLEAMKVPYLRPDDYYAEMLKSDGHMQRIRDSLLFEERKMAAFQRRKKAQEHKKFGKQLNAERIKNKAAEKRMAIDAISQIRKRRKSNNGSAFDVDVAVDKIASQSRHYNGGSNSSSGHSSKFNKYQRGRDAERNNNNNNRKNKNYSNNRRRGGGGGGGKRPGKGRRQKMRR